MGKRIVNNRRTHDQVVIAEYEHLINFVQEKAKQIKAASDSLKTINRSDLIEQLSAQFAAYNDLNAYFMKRIEEIKRGNSV